VGRDVQTAERAAYEKERSPSAFPRAVTGTLPLDAGGPEREPPPPNSPPSSLPRFCAE